MGIEDEETGQFYSYDLKTNKKNSDFSSMYNFIDTLSDINLNREDVDDMLILTNIFRINGAGVICYDGLLKIIADMAGGNLIIIPSSVHETIVMSEKTWLDEQELQEMVYSVNREEVPADEILSDHPFRYEREMNRLCMI